MSERYAPLFKPDGEWPTLIPVGTNKGWSSPVDVARTKWHEFCKHFEIGHLPNAVCNPTKEHLVDSLDTFIYFTVAVTRLPQCPYIYICIDREREERGEVCVLSTVLNNKIQLKLCAEFLRCPIDCMNNYIQYFCVDVITYPYPKMQYYPISFWFLQESWPIRVGKDVSIWRWSWIVKFGPADERENNLHSIVRRNVQTKLSYETGDGKSIWRFRSFWWIHPWETWSGYHVLVCRRLVCTNSQQMWCKRGNWPCTCNSSCNKHRGLPSLLLSNSYQKHTKSGNTNSALFYFPFEICEHCASLFRFYYW